MPVFRLEPWFLVPLTLTIKKEVTKMATPNKGNEKAAATRPDGSFELTGIKVLPLGGILTKILKLGYTYRYTTGPFLLPENSGSLDWMLLNNDTTVQSARVTVFRCPVGSVKTPVAPGALTVTLDPGVTTHNANEYPEGMAYEVQVECNSQLILPYVSVWPGKFGVVIPGTGINSGTFVLRMP